MLLTFKVEKFFCIFPGLFYCRYYPPASLWLSLLSPTSAPSSPTPTPLSHQPSAQLEMSPPSPGSVCLPVSCWCNPATAAISVSTAGVGAAFWMAARAACARGVPQTARARPCFPWSHSSRTAGHAVDVFLFSKDPCMSQTVCGNKRDPFQALFERKYGKSCFHLLQ